MARDSGSLNALLKSTRKLGYGARDGGLFPHAKSIAVPIIGDGHAHACISINWIASALTMSKGIAQFARLIQRVVEVIQTNIAKAGAATDWRNDMPPDRKNAPASCRAAAQIATEGLQDARHDVEQCRTIDANVEPANFGLISKHYCVFLSQCGGACTTSNGLQRLVIGQ